MNRVFQGFCVLLASAGLTTARADAVVIEEIMHHPVAGQPEYIVFYNQTATPLDIAEWRLTGGVSFSFPEFSAAAPLATFLKGFERIVLSSASEAVTRAAYDVPREVRVFGPWTGRLNNSGERITLKDKNGALLCSLKYGSNQRWPAGASGTGHSLVLREPNAQADDGRNWSVSSGARPKPGAPRQFPQLPPISLNEVHLHAPAAIDWVELYNHSDEASPVNGLFLASHSDFSDRVNLDGAIPARGFRSWPVTFSMTDRDCSVFLVTSNRDIVASHVFPWVDPDRNWQVFPDGSHEWYVASGPTRDGSNHVRRETNVVINEIMFDPPSQLGLSEYVELFNGGSSEVDVSGWRFTDGIEFRFPPGTKLSAGGYLVVAGNESQMRAVYGPIAVVGNFRGKLDNDGELLRLVDAQGNLVNEVDYRVGGNWPALAKGGGSSLELVNPRMDNRLPSAWRDSDESAKAKSMLFTRTKTYLQTNALGPPTDYRELHLQLAGSGHVVIENLALVAHGTNLILNAAHFSTNGSGDNGWLAQGNHWESFITNRQLHLIAEGHGDNRPNHVEIDVPGLEPGAECTLTFNGRWISGEPRVIVQSWDHSLGGSFLFPVPPNLGTPGAPNSQFVAEASPQLDHLIHAPPVPHSTNRVLISVQVTSVTPPASVQLWHRGDTNEASASWSTQALRDDGQGGDKRAGDGVYSAELDDYHVSGQVVQFFVRATAKHGGVTTLPERGEDAPALFVVDDQVLPPKLRTARIVVSARDQQVMTEGNTAKQGFRFPRLSNHYFNMTFIGEEKDIRYGAKVRSSGSPLTRTLDLRRVKFKLPRDQAFRGRVKFNYDDDAAEGKAYHNRVVRYLLYLLGEPASENEFIRFIVNAGEPSLREDTEPVAGGFLERHFPQGDKGELYRIDDEWAFADDGEGLNIDSEWNYQGDNDLLYRTSWQKRSRATEDNFAHLIDLCRVLSRTNTTETEIDQLLDPIATLKLVAVRGLIGDWDNFTMQRGRNGYLYRRPADGRFQLLHWDSDEAFITGQPLYGERLRSWIESPQHQRLFHAFIAELIQLCAQDPVRFRTWLELERASTDKAVRQADYLAFFRERTPEVWQALGTETPFRVFANHSDPLPTRKSEISLGGLAPAAVSMVRVVGQSEGRLEWRGEREWMVRGLKLQPGDNRLLVQGLSPRGRVLCEATVRITQTR